MKVLICTLLLFSFISCKNDDNNPDPDDPTEPESVTNPDGTTSDPTAEYKLVNKTGDNDVVEVVLFESYEKLKKNDQTDCAPVILQENQCLTIKANQFNLLQIILDEKSVCGTVAVACNPGNYEVTKTGKWFWADYYLSELQEETNSEEESENKEEASSEESNKESEENEKAEEPKTCVPLECKKPEAPAKEDEEENKEDS